VKAATHAPGEILNRQQTMFKKATTHLPVKNLRETLEYYRNTLGFYDEWSFGGKDGGIRRDDIRLLFYEDPVHVQLINSPSGRLAVLWFVDNIDEVLKEFTTRGVQLADPLREHPYGLREFAFVDINGYYVRVAQGEER
jgi:catechol 2,3-dioxygenase-like lactoylglutathione lyase family enzyme